MVVSNTSEAPPYAGSSLSALFDVIAIESLGIDFPVATFAEVDDGAVAEELLADDLDDVQPTRRATVRTKLDAMTSLRDFISHSSSGRRKAQLGLRHWG